MKKLLSLFLILIVCVSVFSLTVSARDVSKEETLAGELKALGLFYGVSETNFDLERAPTRVEAVVMLIRVLGKEAEALDGTWRHPFTDVPAWATNYIGYAYSKGLANGVDYTRFGANEKATSAMYITYVLRALGYSDAGGADFKWDNPYALAQTTGILSSTVNIKNFWRADVVQVSHAALTAYLKGTTEPLYNKLIKAGVFTLEKFNTTYNKSGKTPTVGAELTPEEIYATCSPAIFYIEVYDKSGNALGSGSGFFIDGNGTAVTNYHVIDGAHSAKIQLSDTGEVFDVAGVYDCSADNDWAVIKVNYNSKNYLKIGDPATVVGAAKVYAIGSPLGLQNTISEGLISNPSRILGGVEYIQISAPISHGSSGGALVNKYGQVIGITSGGFDEGQNLNIVVPMTALSGYSHGSVTALSTLNASSTPSVTSSAYSFLANAILKNKTGYDEELGHEFNYTSDDGSEEFSIYYDDRDDTIYTRVTYYIDGAAVRYYFIVSDEYNGLTYAIYQYYKYNNYNDSYEKTSSGNSIVSVTEFCENYKYIFDEYQGSSRDVDVANAVYLHAETLEYINAFFEVAGGSYSVKDLGYTSYYPFTGETDSGVYITPASLSVRRGGVAYASFDCTDPALEYATFTIVVEDERIVNAEWDDMEDDVFPWDIRITGVSKGVTTVSVINDVNNVVVTITVTVN